MRRIRRAAARRKERWSPPAASADAAGEGALRGAAKRSDSAAYHAGLVCHEPAARASRTKRRSRRLTGARHRGLSQRANGTFSFKSGLKVAPSPTWRVPRPACKAARWRWRRRRLTAAAAATGRLERVVAPISNRRSTLAGGCAAARTRPRGVSQDRARVLLGVFVGPIAGRPGNSV